jgi:integrase
MVPGYRKPKCAKYAESEHRIRRFTPEEERFAVEFFERMGEQDMADYVVLSVDTGLRQGELLNASYKDVVGGKLRVWGVDAKSGKSRVVPLTKRAVEIIARRASAAQLDAGRILPDLEKRIVTYQWNKVREQLGLTTDKEFVPHILRHEFCSRLADRGASAPQIMALAGHSGLSVSQRYIHLTGHSVEQAIGLLDVPALVPQTSNRLEDMVAAIQASGVDLVALVTALASQQKAAA